MNLYAEKYVGLKGNALVMTFIETIGQGILFLTSGFWALYILELGATFAVVGLIVSIPNFIRILLQAPVGYLTDVKGRKKLVVWGGFVASFAPFVYFFADQWVYLIPGVILEAFTNVVLPARQAMFAEAIEPEMRATAFAAIHTFFAVASSILPVLGGYMFENMGLVQGMKAAFLISGVVMLFASILRILYLKEEIIKDANPLEGFSFKDMIKDLFTPITTVKPLRIAILAAFMFSLASGILIRYSVVYAVDIIGLSKVEWGFVMGGIGMISIFTRIPIGKMIDRFRRRTCIFLSYALRPFFILAFTRSLAFSHVLLVQIFDNVFGYIQQPALEALVIDISSFENIGRSYGVLNMIPSIALTISPLLGAFMWERFGAASAFYASMMFSFIAATVITFMKSV